MKNVIIKSGHIAFQLPVKSPFIVAFHHVDDYPQGNEKMEPIEYLNDWNKGDDFNSHAPWRMYYGDKIPGFPVHPHRGFETITVVEQGFVDHSDSLGSTGRYGEGDVQWLTAGEGVQHCEMLPLVYQDRKNTAEFFQIWLNLPSKNKMVNPDYKMLWHEEIPIGKQVNSEGKETKIKVIAGQFEDIEPLAPTPNSWAYEKENNVAIWLISMEPGATFTLRPTSKTASRMLYFYRGEAISVHEALVPKNSYVELVANEEIVIENVSGLSSTLLLLEGEPIREPMAARGPFVMNTETEILQAFRDYQRTEFGGWPWERRDHVNSPEMGRFAKYSDGRMEYPKNK